ncbi:MAG: hypothetical protein AAGA56_12885 [Myxococcota bacterium]
MLADAHDFPRLEGAQQHGLHVDGQLPHLVEEQRPPARRFEGPDVIFDRPGERALAVTEQLAAHEVPGEGGAVHDHERVVAQARPIVKGTRDQLFAHPARALDEHAHQGTLESLEGGKQLARSHRVADQTAVMI